MWVALPVFAEIVCDDGVLGDIPDEVLGTVHPRNDVDPMPGVTTH